MTVSVPRLARLAGPVALLAGVSLALASCGPARAAALARAHSAAPASTATPTGAPSVSSHPTSRSASAASSPTSPVTHRANRNPPLPAPVALVPFGGPAGQGSWIPAGRRVNGDAAVYETTLVPPGGTQPAGISWMDTQLLSARLYSGSLSPGGGPYQYTAPIQPAQAASLVAAFNGGFYMNVAGGGYYTQGRVIDPLVAGSASLVIYANGSVNVGAWGQDVTMTPDVVAVRQNLVPLVAAGQPTPQAASADWQAWGATCGVNSCAASVPGIEYQWRSALGVTGNGALVYVAGPALSPLQLAQLLVRAGVVRGMQLDINPDWPVFVTYDPALPNGLAAPANGSKLLATTVQGPATFFEPSWARDFVTMSVRW